jgi:hypothetical protein
MLPEKASPVVAPPAPLAARVGTRLWVQILVVLLLAVVAQAIGLGFAYILRCKPGQGNEWCGVGSVGAAVFGFAAAFCVVLAGTIVIVLRRGGRRGGGRVGAVRILAVAFGVILVVPCAWMIGIGWERNKSDLGLWLGLALGVALIVAAFIRRRGSG